MTPDEALTLPTDDLGRYAEYFDAFGAFVRPFASPQLLEALDREAEYFEGVAAIRALPSTAE